MSDRGREPTLVVVGAGHAGCEAALIAARMGCAVTLVTSDLAGVARMPCNPALGGLGKGHLIREVDAMGGLMGVAGDLTGIHFRRLNRRKGAAVRATRVQSDKARYAAAVLAALRRQPGLTLAEAHASRVEVQGGRVTGVGLADGGGIPCRAVVLATGTFLGGLIHVGLESHPGGREGEPAALELSGSLRGLGLDLGRLKTGTPCRIDRTSIDFDRLEQQPGDQPPPRLSFWSDWPGGCPPLPQICCHITYTNERTHDIIRANLDRSPLFSGKIEGVGPRYCPSIEDKVTRFADRSRHQIFLEPEGLDALEIYPSGISTSLPVDAQEELVHSIAGLERARIVRPGYAVEYDFVEPTQLLPTLQVKEQEGLYLAGQINGTSGYEEAAAQGILAGINAARWLRGRSPLILRRDQAYLGVMVDDLVTRGTSEPYRMFTSRAEHRLLLREDNADERLTPAARDLGLIDDGRWRLFSQRQEQQARLMDYLDVARVGRDDGRLLDPLLEEAGTASARPGTSLTELLRRPEVSLALLDRAGLLPAESDAPLARERAELSVKYAGYIRRQAKEAERLSRLEDQQIPPGTDYDRLSGLSNEAREKLRKVRPLTLGQASRIPGLTPAAIAVLQIYLKTQMRE